MVESVAVTVSGGGTTAGPVHLAEIRNYLHLTVSPSPAHFTFAFSIFACTSHESPCVMSTLIPFRYTTERYIINVIVMC